MQHSEKTFNAMVDITSSFQFSLMYTKEEIAAVHKENRQSIGQKTWGDVSDYLTDSIKEWLDQKKIEKS